MIDVVLRKQVINRGKKMKKATRLSEDWTLPETWRNWALAERPDLNPDRIADEFRDFWIAKSGANATKMNWQATWRNWIRRQRKTETQAANRAQSHALRQPKRTTKQDWTQAREIAKRHMAGLKKALVT